jgi:membrane-bound lytic murein transglycosylase D
VSLPSLRSANRLRGNTIHPGQELVITSAPRGMSVAAAQVAMDDTPAPRASGGNHVVRRGETLWSIARRHGVSMQSLANHNRLSDAETLNVGRVLKVPAAAQLASTRADDENLQRLTYVVRRGDTLSMIADRFRVRVQDLLGWNNLASAHRLKPGQRLVMFVDDTRQSGG